MEDQLKKTVAIIGAGPSGLATAKECIAQGLKVKIFEKASNVGGLWNPESGGTWPGMKTNISKFTCGFSDFPWPESVPDFPTQRDVYVYLNSYCDAFSLWDCMNFDTVVIKTKDLGKKWQIIYRRDNAEHNEEFDFLVIASGLLNSEYYPNIPGRETFQGKISHSLRYRGPSSVEGKNVVVVGGAFSGAEIAVDLSRGDKVVTNVFQNPIWIVSKYLSDPTQNEKERLPMDFVFYHRGKRQQILALPADIALQKRHEFLNLLSNQKEINADLEVSDFTKPAKISITEGYLTQIKEEKITLKKGAIKNFDSTGINFADGTHLAADHILFATGYQLQLPFFEQNVLEKISFDYKDQIQPLLLYKCVFHPQMQNLSFVGLYKGIFFATIELQARWTAHIFSGNGQLPSEEVMMEGIQAEKKIRELPSRPQFPHGDYVGFADSTAEEIGAVPDFKKLEVEDPELYEKLTKYPHIPAHYRLTGPGEKKDLALKQINNLINSVHRK